MIHGRTVFAGLLAASPLFLMACGRLAPVTSDETWFTADYDVGALRGHEDITRFAVERANSALGSAVFPKVASGDYGRGTANPIVQGNHATDFPNRISGKIKAFYGSNASKLSQWHDDGSLQSIHFLRDYPNGSLVSFSTACQTGVSRIINAVKEAQRLHQAGNANESLYFLGHATHIVQDSFAPAHTRRNGDQLRNIADICSYGKDQSGVCKHPKVDFSSPEDLLDLDQDRPWGGGMSCQLNPNDRSWGCLKKEAQAAAKASAGLMIAFARYRNASASDLEAALKYNLGNPSDENSGYFVCR